MSSNTDQFETLKEYYAQGRRRYWMMAPHERLVVNALVVAIVAMLLFLVVINPALKSRAEAEVQLNAKRSVLQWVKDNEQRAIAASRTTTGQAPKSGQSLMAVVTSSSSQMGLALKRYEPEGDDKLRVWLEDQSFNKMVRWLDSLQKQHGMSVVNVSVDAGKEPGVVTAKLVLRG